MWDEPKEPRKIGIPAEYVVLGLVAAALVIGGIVMIRKWVNEGFQPPAPPAKTQKAPPPKQ